MPGKIKHLILVASGKGGVGKSTVATNLALTLAHLGKRTGLLDADMYGLDPNDVWSIGASGSSDGQNSSGRKIWSQAYVDGLHDRAGSSGVWRGPMLAGAVTQFVNDVEWGDLDYLIFDLPPGTATSIESGAEIRSHWKHLGYNTPDRCVGRRLPSESDVRQGAYPCDRYGREYELFRGR